MRDPAKGSILSDSFEPLILIAVRSAALLASRHGRPLCAMKKQPFRPLRSPRKSKRGNVYIHEWAEHYAEVDTEQLLMQATTMLTLWSVPVGDYVNEATAVARKPRLNNSRTLA